MTRLYSAADMFQDRQKNRRKIIFLISDGSNSRQNRHTFNETARELLRQGRFGVFDFREPLGSGSGRQVDCGARAGGTAEICGRHRRRYFLRGKAADLERLYSDVTEEARNQYTLTFEPSGVDKSHDFHPIEVRVRRPGLNILTRQGYYDSGIGR